MPPNTVYVGHPTLFGNPYIGSDLQKFYGTEQRQQIVNLYRDLLRHKSKIDYREKIRRELRGKNLACWCRADQPCHADVLLEIANA